MTGFPGRAFVIMSLVVGAAPALAVAPSEARPAVDLIREVIRARLGVDAAVELVKLDLPSGVTDVAFTSVRLDPAAWLGRPLRVTLVPATGRAIIGAAEVRVTTPHAVAARDLDRGIRVTAEDVAVREGELIGVPLRRLPQINQVVGGRTLRVVKAGAVLLPGAVAVRRAVEPGDQVTVVALAGTVEVSATLVAADGGEPGAVIRVTNPDTRRDLRGRVLGEGRVEVMHGR